jgi:ABC-type branched-subunit amino acid transport system permease subunit
LALALALALALVLGLRRWQASCFGKRARASGEQRALVRLTTAYAYRLKL